MKKRLRIKPMEEFIRINNMVYILDSKNINTELKIILSDFIKAKKDSFIKVGLSKNISSISVKLGCGKSYMVDKLLYNELKSKFNLSDDLFFEYTYEKYLSRKEYRKEIKLKRSNITKYNNKLISCEIKPKCRKDWCVKNREELLKKSTSAECALYRSFSDKLKNRSERQKSFVINNHIYFPDFYIKSKNIIIEVDGGYHNTEEQIIKDRNRDADFKSKGIETIRITNEDVFDKHKRKEFIKYISTITKTSINL